MFFAVKILNKVLSPKNNWIIPLIISLVLIIITLLFSEFTHSIETFSVVYAGWFYLIMANVLPIILCLTTKKEKINEKYQS
jgi:hypothetical protein